MAADVWETVTGFDALVARGAEFRSIGMGVGDDRETIARDRLRIIPGQIINLAITDGLDTRWFRSRLEDCDDANAWLTVTRPHVEGGAPLDLPLGKQILLQIPYTHGALYSARVLIESVREAGESEPAMLVVRPTEDWRRVQRRQAVRVPTEIRASAARLQTPDGWKPINLSILDLSAQGALITCDHVINGGDMLELVFNLADGGTDIHARASVVRVKHLQVGKKQTWDAGCAFENLRSAEGDRIVRYVFATQRAIAQKRLVA
jgi:c-di-GMP-binding flagellar brake protein YcgR